MQIVDGKVTDNKINDEAEYYDQFQSFGRQILNIRKSIINLESKEMQLNGAERKSLTQAQNALKLASDSLKKIKAYM